MPDSGLDSGVFNPAQNMGLRSTRSRPITSTSNGSREELDVSASISGVAETNLDKDNDEVTVYHPTGTLANGTQTTVGSSAVQILAANTSRKLAIIQNVGATAMRVGVSGVTATTGIKLSADDSIVMGPEHIPTAAIFAIRDGVADTTAFATEVT